MQCRKRFDLSISIHKLSEHIWSHFVLLWLMFWGETYTQHVAEILPALSAQVLRCTQQLVTSSHCRKLYTEYTTGSMVALDQLLGKVLQYDIHSKQSLTAEVLTTERARVRINMFTALSCCTCTTNMNSINIYIYMYVYIMLAQCWQCWSGSRQHCEAFVGFLCVNTPSSDWRSLNRVTKKTV